MRRTLPARHRAPTLGTATPEDHLGLADLETRCVVGRETGRLTGDAVDVDREAAVAADEVMVVVADPGLEARGTACRLDAAHDAGVVKRTEDVVDRLGGERAEPRASGRLDLLDGGVRQLLQDGEHCETWRGHSQVVRLQELSPSFDVVHGADATGGGLDEPAPSAGYDFALAFVFVLPSRLSSMPSDSLETAPPGFVGRPAALRSFCAISAISSGA